MSKHTKHRRHPLRRDSERPKVEAPKAPSASTTTLESYLAGQSRPTRASPQLDPTVGHEVAQDASGSLRLVTRIQMAPARRRGGGRMQGGDW